MDDQQARQALDDVQQRHQEILKLENSIKELHDMFMDMAMLVESQGDMVERIEYNVGQSVVAVKKANVELTGAIKHQTAARKKQVMIGGVVGLIVMFNALVLIFL